MDMKRFFLYAIVIAALALAGCGGGGGGGTDPMTGGNGDGPDAAAQLSALIAALGQAGLNVTADSTAADIMAQITAMSDTAREAALATIRSALGLTGMEDADDIAAEITARLGPTGPAPTAKTMGVTFGILGSSMPNNPGSYAGLNAVARPGNEGARVFVRPGNSDNDTTPGIFVGTVAADTATSEGTPTEMEFTDADQLNHDDMEADPDNAGQMRSVMGQFSDGSPTSLAKMFSSTTHERTMEAAGVTTTDTITVVTNIEDAGPLSFSTYYGVADRAGVSGAAALTDHDSDSTTDEVLVLTLATTDHTELAGLLAGTVRAAFPDSRSQTFTFTENPDGDAETMDDNRVFANSMFNGVSGTVECTDTCTVVTDGDAAISSITGSWRFILSGDPSMVMIPGVAQDDDYLAFGWWLRGVQDDDDDNLPYTVGTFATGSQVYTLANVRANVEGTAEYSGPAAGKFARKTLASDGEVATLVAGHFTADAALMAYFGGNDVAVNKQFTIRGTVTNFEDDHGHDIDAGWTVELGTAGFAASGDRAVDPPTGVTAADDTFYGEATGTGGAWQGRFFGNDGDADPVMAGDQFVAPTGVAGEFTGHFANGHVIGAFGATKD